MPSNKMGCKNRRNVQAGRGRGRGARNDAETSNGAAGVKEVSDLASDICGIIRAAVRICDAKIAARCALFAASTIHRRS